MENHKKKTVYSVSQTYLVPIQTQKSTRSVLTVTRKYILRSNSLLLQPLHRQNYIALTYLQHPMGCRQCLPLSVVQLKGKHCQKPYCRNGVVDTFRHSRSHLLGIQVIVKNCSLHTNQHTSQNLHTFKLTLDSEFEMWKLYDFAYHYTTCVSSWGSLLFWIMITNAKAAHVEWLSIFIASIQLSATLQIFTGWMGFITGNFL